MRQQQAKSGKLSHSIPPRLRLGTKMPRACIAQNSPSGGCSQMPGPFPVLTQTDRSDTSTDDMQAHFQSTQYTFYMCHLQLMLCKLYVRYCSRMVSLLFFTGQAILGFLAVTSRSLPNSGCHSDSSVLTLPYNLPPPPLPVLPTPHLQYCVMPLPPLTLYFTPPHAPLSYPTLAAATSQRHTCSSASPQRRTQFHQPHSSAVQVLHSKKLTMLHSKRSCSLTCLSAVHVIRDTRLWRMALMWLCFQ